MDKPISHEAIDIATGLAAGRIPAVEGARRIDELRGHLEPWAPSIEAAKFAETIDVVLNSEGRRLVALGLDQFAAKKIAECLDPAVVAALSRIRERAAKDVASCAPLTMLVT